MPVQTTEDRELITAQARHVRSSARKARLVLEHIRGLPAVDAQAVLAFEKRAVAKDAGKVLKSAMANAENNFGHEPDELVVVLAYADEGPTLKRWKARARGRVNRIKKRTCHITIKVSPALPGEIKPRKERPVVVPRQRAEAPPAVEPEELVDEQVEETAAEPEAAEETEAVEETAAEETETAEASDAVEETAEEPAAEAESVTEEEPAAVEEPAEEEPAAEDEPAEEPVEEEPAAEADQKSENDDEEASS
jgi:large subunit ribosomal protein L22